MNNPDWNNQFGGSSRREILKSLAAAGIGAAGLLAQDSNLPKNYKTGRLDVHHHFELPPAGGGGRGGGRGGRGGVTAWTPEQSLEQMDKFNIGFAMLSHPGDGEFSEWRPVRIDPYHCKLGGRSPRLRVSDFRGATSFIFRSSL